jgi:hypothetical protein
VEKLSGHGTVEDPGGYEEATANSITASPPATPKSAPDQVTMPQPAAGQLGSEAQAPPAPSVGEANKALLVKEKLGKGMELVALGKDAVKTKGASLLALPAVKEAVGQAVTQPVVGGLSGKDIADLVNQGNQIGVWHVGGKAGKAAELVAGAGQAQGSPADVAQPVMAVRTQATPPVVDGGRLSQDLAAGHALGLGHDQAHANALGKQGLAFYKGDAKGAFRKIKPF